MSISQINKQIHQTHDAKILRSKSCDLKLSKTLFAVVTCTLMLFLTTFLKTAVYIYNHTPESNIVCFVLSFHQAPCFYLLSESLQSVQVVLVFYHAYWLCLQLFAEELPDVPAMMRKEQNKIK